MNTTKKSTIVLTAKEKWQRSLAESIAEEFGVGCNGLSFNGDVDRRLAAYDEFVARVHELAIQWADRRAEMKANARTFRWNPLTGKHEHAPSGHSSEWDFLTTSERRSLRIEFCESKTTPSA